MKNYLKKNIISTPLSVLLLLSTLPMAINLVSKTDLEYLAFATSCSPEILKETTEYSATFSTEKSCVLKILLG